MKKKVSIILALLSTVSISVCGCSLPEESIKEATEYLNDNGDVVEESDAASSLSSEIIVINDLFEPILEENTESASEASSEASTEASAEASTETVSETPAEDDGRDHEVNIVFFGDSQLANGRDDGTSIANFLQERVPYSHIYNMAIGGTSASVEQTTSIVSADTLTSTSFLGMAYCFAGKSDRYATLAERYPDILETMNSIDPADVDYYVFSYGTNDFLNNAPLDVSTYNSQTEQAHAVYNSMLMAIEKLEDVSPDANYIILSPFYGIYVTPDGAYIGDSYIVSNGIGTLSAYADKIKNAAETTGAIYIDNMYSSKYDLYLDTASEYLMDNLHLSLTGRQIVARILAHEINFREQNEPYAYLETDFVKISEFDPDEYYRYDEDEMKAYFPESWEKYIKGEFPLAQPSQEALDEYKTEQESGG